MAQLLTRPSINRNVNNIETKMACSLVDEDSRTGTLGNVEYHCIIITSRFSLTPRVIFPVRVPSIGQVELFNKKLFNHLIVFKQMTVTLNWFGLFGFMAYQPL